ncbi:MAG TPA: serine protease [Caulobacteraceae bacterium]|nr:serine protease [Caulobacteraceae bacterium]
MPRPPDWLIYLAALALLLSLSLFRTRADAPRPPPPVPGADNAPISPNSPFATARLEHVAARRANRGAAFSVSDKGVWLTARNAVAGCPKPMIVVGDGWAARIRLIAVRGDVAVFATDAGAPALPLLKAVTPQAGDPAFVAGFSRGRPGEAAARYLGARAHDGRAAWAEVGRTDGLEGPLFGFAGAPVLNLSGAVIGMAIGDAPRLGRIAAAPSTALTAALAAARRTANGAGPTPPISLDDYGLAADSLRRATSVVPVICG